MRNIFAIALSASLFATLLSAAPALAADPSAPAAEALLAPGKPAGLKQAQSDTRTIIDLAGIAAVTVGIALLIGGNDKSNTTVPPSTAPLL